MRFFFALISAALVIAALTGVGLAWDGSYTLFSILDTQSPRVSYGRITQLPLHWIVVEVSRFTSDLATLRTAFGIVYVVITLLALVASWWIVRSRKGAEPLFVWAALGIGLGTLPGQVCAICQSTLSVQLFFPILFAILIRIPRRTVPVIALIATAIFFLHPVALGLFLIAAALAFLVGWHYRNERRRMWLWALAFAGLSVIAWLRFLLFRSLYETGELSLKVLNAHFYEALAGLPIIALCLAWFAALLIFAEPLVIGYMDLNPEALLREGDTRSVRVRFFTALKSANLLFPLALGSILTAGALLTIWAFDPHLWAEEVSFREWAPLVSLPFVLIAALEALAGQAAEPSDTRQKRTRIIQLSGLIFFVVVSIQGLNWLNLTNRLQETMRASPAPCLSGSSLAWLQRTPLEHWSLTAYSLVIQDKSPEKLVMAGSGCADESFLSGLAVAEFGPGDWNLRDWRGGWFDLRALAQQLIAADQTPPRCTFPLTWGWYGIERAGADWHRWTGGRARMRVLVARDTDAILRGELVSIQQPNEVDLLLNGKPTATVGITQAGWQPFGPIPLALGHGENSIEFVSRNPPVQIPTDTRWLAIALGNPTLTLDAGATICR
jgi:hypothetical protein